MIYLPCRDDCRIHQEPMARAPTDCSKVMRSGTLYTSRTITEFSRPGNRVERNWLTIAYVSEDLTIVKTFLNTA